MKKNNNNKKYNNLTTIVTAYFQLNKSKHGHNKYIKWIENMLTNITNAPLYIFCDSQSEELIKSYRWKTDALKNRTYIKVIELDDFLVDKYKNDFITHYNKLDPEKNIHSPELYMVWAEKSEFLQKVSNDNPFNSDFFLWCDIGCFRNRQDKQDISLDKISNFPNEDKIKLIPKDKIILTETGNLNPWRNLHPNGLTTHSFTYVKASIGGTMFGGYKKAIDEWHTKYYNTLELFIKNNRFIGKDQSIMANIAVAYPDSVILFKPNYGDRWFYFHWILN